MLQSRRLRGVVYVDDEGRISGDGLSLSPGYHLLQGSFEYIGNEPTLTVEQRESRSAKAAERPDHFVAMLLDTDVYVRPASRGIRIISDEGDLTSDDLTEMLSTGYYHLTAEFRRIREP